jgi:hypothetical protein
MRDHLESKSFDLIVYTAALEHMHFDTGRASLVECADLITVDGLLVLTCPRTPEDQDGYDTQYRAHVYEWKMSELTDTLDAIGFEICERWGLHATKTDIMKRARRMGHGQLVERIAKFVPSEWLVPVLAPAFPTIAKEIGLLCKLKGD